MPKTADIEDAQILWTPHDTAGRLRVSESTLAKWRMTGDGPEFVKLGFKVRYRPLAVEAFIAKRTRRSTSQTAAA